MSHGGSGVPGSLLGMTTSTRPVRRSSLRADHKQEKNDEAPEAAELGNSVAQGTSPRMRDERPPGAPISIPHAGEEFAPSLSSAQKSRFSSFWSPMPRSERGSEDSTAVLKADLAGRRGDLLGMTEWFFISRLRMPDDA
jgi:hypothetical protein